jgi:hypothetical protein
MDRVQDLPLFEPHPPRCHPHPTPQVVRARGGGGGGGGSAAACGGAAGRRAEDVDGRDDHALKRQVGALGQRHFLRKGFEFWMYIEHIRLSKYV